MTKYKTYLCDLAYMPGVTPLIVEPTTCSNVANHEPEPEGYIARQEWFKWKAKTHEQKRCEICLRWEIWVPK